ncbi:MAG: DUF1559 domain-containing protein [Planctomycetales bacterium]|nr:DUF1559 domain-containing protein [Planctomycetales bacterium]
MSAMSVSRRACGVSLVELLVVLAIISILMGLLLPAVLSTRNRARELICKNNLHQMNIAVANFIHTHKRIPGAGKPGRIGGWTVELLPYLEQQNLFNAAPIGAELERAPQVLLRVPRIYRCPYREALENIEEQRMDVAHYVLEPLRERKGCVIYDAPVTHSVPWAEGPELPRVQILSAKGPHHGGFFSSSNSGGVQSSH